MTFVAELESISNPIGPETLIHAIAIHGRTEPPMDLVGANIALPLIRVKLNIWSGAANLLSLGGW